MTPVGEKGCLGAYLQACLSVVKICHYIFPVLSGSAHFSPNCINFVFSCNTRDKLTTDNHSIQL